MALILPLASPIATQYKCRMQTRISSKLYVAVAITRHPTRRQIYFKLLCRTINQPGFWFPAVAVESIRRLTDRRMMRTVVNRIELRILQVALELIVNVDN